MAGAVVRALLILLVLASPAAAQGTLQDAWRILQGRTYPGWSMEVLRYLYETRKITASGHETTDTDPGLATSKGDYSLETCILSRNRWQIELLANLDRCPEDGALVVASFPKPENGSGFPARVFAILP